MSYLEWNIESIWYLPFLCVVFMVLWKLFFFFLSATVDSSKTKGNFPYPLRECSQPCVLVFLAPKGHILRSRIKPLFGKYWFPGKKRQGWRLGGIMTYLERGLTSGWEWSALWFDVPKERGTHSAQKVVGPEWRMATGMLFMLSH